MNEEFDRKYLELVEMIAQNQRDMIRLIQNVQDGSPERERLTLVELRHLEEFMGQHFQRFDLIYKIIIPIIIALLGLLYSEKVWTTAKLILTGKP